MKALTQPISLCGIECSHALTRFDAEQHEVADEHVHTHGDEVDRFDPDAVIEHAHGVLGDGRRPVRGKGHARKVMFGHEIEGGNRVGGVSALRHGDVERARGLRMLEIDERFGRHDLHLAPQRAL